MFCMVNRIGIERDVIALLPKRKEGVFCCRVLIVFMAGSVYDIIYRGCFCGYLLDSCFLPCVIISCQVGLDVRISGSIGLTCLSCRTCPL